MTGQAGDQSYDQAFSSIADGPDSETLTSRQYVPAVQHGFAARWQRGWEGVDVLAGADTRDVSATNNEQTFAPNGTPRPDDPHRGLSADQRRLRAVHRSAGVERHGHVDRRPGRPSPAVA